MQKKETTLIDIRGQIVEAVAGLVAMALNAEARDSDEVELIEEILRNSISCNLFPTSPLSFIW